MRELSNEEVKSINGAWFGLVVVAARLGWAAYRHYRLANAASWAARGAGIVSGTYNTMSYLDPNNN